MRLRAGESHGRPAAMRPKPISRDLPEPEDQLIPRQPTAKARSRLANPPASAADDSASADS